MSGQLTLLSVNASQVARSSASDMTKKNVVEEVSDDEPEENDLLELGLDVSYKICIVYSNNHL